MGIPTLIDLLPACVKEPGRISAKIKGTVTLRKTEAQAPLKCQQIACNVKKRIETESLQRAATTLNG